MVVYLKEDQRLRGIRKEWHTRKKDGKRVCYVLQDREGRICLLGQKLPYLATFINDNVIDKSVPWQRVNTVGMWEIINKVDNRVGGFHKGRWKVLQTELEAAVPLFESMRDTHREAALVGDSSCYQVA